MKNISKRLQEEKKKISKGLVYTLSNGISLLKKVASANFNESVETHISLNINPKYYEYQLRTTVILPHGTGKKLIIAALVSLEKILEAKDAGADIVGNQDLIDDISKGILHFDLLITSPEMMPKLAKLGRILGPKGLMPSPKSGTITLNLKKTIEEFKKGKLEYKTDKTGIIHICFGKVNFEDEKLKENLLAIYNSVEINKPSGIKEKYIKKITICSTMGPSISMNIESFRIA
jgi:large subunit ribosomal protein L1